jgi:hypothetical protein
MWCPTQLSSADWKERVNLFSQFEGEKQMLNSKSVVVEDEISRDRLAELLNEDLAREYQAIIGYASLFPSPQRR